MSYLEMESIMSMMFNMKKYIYNYCNQQDIEKLDEEIEAVLEKLQKIDGELFDQVMNNNEF